MELKEKKILIIGLARSGMAAIRLLHAAGAQHITLTERRVPEEIAELAYYLTVVNRSITGEDVLIDNGEMLRSNFIW